MMDANVFLVTGGSGYVGRHLLPALHAAGRCVRATHHTAAPTGLHPGTEWLDVGDIGSRIDWRPALMRVGVVVHLAARAHRMQESSTDPLAEFRRVNVAGTARLASSAANAGVRRFVHVSSVKVNGELSNAPFTETDAPRPEDAYGLSKLEAEQALKSIQADTGMEVVIVRPPLVFGADAPGNFGRLLAAVARGVPMPFGSVDNRRSLVNVCNLVDFLLLCCEHTNAAGETFFAADSRDLSTAELIRHLAKGMGRRPRLVPVPEAMLRVAGRIVGRGAQVTRLCGSLQVSTAKAGELLGWRAAVSIEEGLAAAACEYSRASVRQP